MKSANILMDYTDLVSFFKRGLPITGIQRVVYEITSAIQADDLDCVITPIGITPFKRRLAPISAPMLELIEAYGRTNTVKGRSLVAKAVEELSYVRIFKNQPAAAADSSMPRSAPWLVMLGASWSRSNYGRHRQRAEIRQHLLPQGDPGPRHAADRAAEAHLPFSP